MADFDLPATFSAIATACFGGLPAAISVRILALIVLRLRPLASGIPNPTTPSRGEWRGY